MRKLSYLLGLVCLLSASSCARYHYYSFQPSQSLEEQKDGFTYQTSDSLMVKFRWQAGEQLTLDVHNLGSQTVALDWSRSALIVNNQKQSNYHKTAETKSVEMKGNFQNLSQSVSYTNQNYSAVLPYSFSRYTLQMQGLKKQVEETKEAFVRVKYAQKRGTPSSPVRVKQFEKAASPFAMRVFLSYRRGQAEERSIDQEFWVKEIIDTECPDINKIVAGEQVPPLDKHTTNKPRVTIQTVSATATVGMLTLAGVVVGIAISKEEKR